MMLPALVWLVLSFLPIVASWKVPPEYAILPSEDGHFFQQADGSPFFWQADTAWLLFHRLNYSECEAYLSDRASKGFNVVLAVGFTQIGIDSPNRNGDLTFIDYDVTKPNEPYWAYIDSIIELAWSKGIRIALVPAWGKYVHSDSQCALSSRARFFADKMLANAGSVINITTAKPFGNFIGQRYPYLPKLLVADTNPWWMNKTAVKADYATGGVPPTYDHVDWSDVYDALAEGITTGERAAISSATWKPLMTIHPTNQWFSGGPIALASAFLGDREWLTFDTSQSGHADYPPNPPIPWWNARRVWEPVELMYAAGETSNGTTRPALDNEAHYEARYNNGKSINAYWNATDVRIGSWQAVFSGAAGITYGADNVMQMYVPGLFEPAGSGPARSWAEDIHLPGSVQMQYIKKAIEDRGDGSYFQRLPAQHVIIGDAGTDDKRVTATSDAGGSWIMVYTPTGMSMSIDTGILAGCNVSASWYNPLDGSYSSFKFFPCEATPKPITDFVPPTDEQHTDWVLVLEQQM